MHLTVHWQHFYLDARQCLVHHSFAGGKRPSPPRTRDQYTSDPSTKIDALLRILKHHKANPGAGPLTNASSVGGGQDSNHLIRSEDVPAHMQTPCTNAEGVVESRPSIPEGVDLKTHPDKAVVYMAFPSHYQWVKAVRFWRVPSHASSLLYRTGA